MSIFEGFLSTSETLDAFSDRAFVDAMLRFEAALARAQAAEGLIPESAAHSIVGSCKVELFDVAKIVRESGRAGSVAIPLVKALREAVGLFNAEAAPFVHFGSTSQDVIDSAMALVTREAVTLIAADLAKAVSALLRLAVQHAETPMLARTLMQPASVTSFGFKCAGWAAPLVRSRIRLHNAAKHALQAATGRRGRHARADEGAGRRGAPAHGQGTGPGRPRRDVAHAARRMGRARLRARVDHGQPRQGRRRHLAARPVRSRGSRRAERTGPRRLVGDAAQAQPVASMVAIAAAHRAPQRVAALLGAMPQQHERALGAWQAELAEWPQLLMSAHGSVRAMAGALPGLQVDAARMRANIERLRAELPRDAADEWFDPGLAINAGHVALAEVKALQARLSDKELFQ
jgi:3-carboxy-cis,cis-muconate cycloisomerase